MNLATENCLISELPKILTPKIVIHMDEERVRDLASESEDVQTERHQLQHEIKILSEGLKKCQRFRPHERTGLLRTHYTMSVTDMCTSTFFLFQTINALEACVQSSFGSR